MEKETHLRTLIKSIIWRIIATLTTILFAYIFTKDINKSWKLGIIDSIFKFILYYIYERLFIRIKWGYKNGKDLKNPTKTKIENTKDDMNI